MGDIGVVGMRGLDFVFSASFDEIQSSEGLRIAVMDVARA